MGRHSIRVEKDGFRAQFDSITIAASKVVNYSIELNMTDRPVVNTLSVTNVSYSGARIDGQIINDGGAEIKECGFYFGEDTISYQKIAISEAANNFSYSLANLTYGKQYWYTAFAQNVAGTGRGSWLSFYTSELTDAMVVTKEPYEITSTSASVLGQIVSSGNTEIIECGFMTKKSSAQSYTKYVCAPIDGEMRLTLTDLEEGTEYRYKAYATNTKGTVFGDEFSFKTSLNVRPTVLTNMASNIEYNNVSLSGTIIDDGGSGITEYGFYYGESEINLFKQQVGGTIMGNFTYSLSQLQEGHRYLYQAYARNTKGETRGDIVEFYTKQHEAPSVNTIGVKNVSSTSATLLAAINSLGTAGVSEYGFYYGTSSSPNIKVPVGTSPNVGEEFTTKLDNILNAGIQYYYTAYAKANNAEVLGEVLSFVTKAPPTVSTNSQYTLGLTSITTGGVVQSLGAITSCGICWSTTNGVPTLSDHVVYSSTNTSSYSCTISNCTNSTRYYIRAFAVNQDGIAYGETLTVVSASMPSIEADIYNSSCSATKVNSKYVYSVKPVFIVSNPSHLTISEVGFYCSQSRDNLVNTPITGITKTTCSSSDGTNYRGTKSLTISGWYNVMYYRGYMIVTPSTIM